MSDFSEDSVTLDRIPVRGGPSPAAGLDPEAVRHYLWSERHESEHPGDGYYESCMECMRAADATIAGLSRSGGEAPDDDPISDSRQPEDGPPPGRWPR